MSHIDMDFALSNTTRSPSVNYDPVFEVIHKDLLEVGNADQNAIRGTSPLPLGDEDTNHDESNNPLPDDLEYERRGLKRTLEDDISTSTYPAKIACGYFEIEDVLLLLSPEAPVPVPVPSLPLLEQAPTVKQTPLAVVLPRDRQPSTASLATEKTRLKVRVRRDEIDEQLQVLKAQIARCTGEQLAQVRLLCAGLPHRYLKAIGLVSKAKSAPHPASIAAISSFVDSQPAGASEKDIETALKANSPVLAMIEELTEAAVLASLSADSRARLSDASWKKLIKRLFSNRDARNARLTLSMLEATATAFKRVSDMLA